MANRRQEQLYGERSIPITTGNTSKRIRISLIEIKLLNMKILNSDMKERKKASKNSGTRLAILDYLFSYTQTPKRTQSSNSSKQ